MLKSVNVSHLLFLLSIACHLQVTQSQSSGICSTCREYSSHCCEDGAEPVRSGVSFSRHCPGLITQKELSVAPGNDVILSADAGTRCLEECTWISPVSEYQRQLQCDFNLETAPGTVCGGKLEFLGGLPEGLCEVRLVGAELSRDEGEWKVLATASASQVRFPTSTSSWVSDTLWVRVTPSTALSRAAFLGVTITASILGCGFLVACFALLCCAWKKRSSRLRSERQSVGSAADPGTDEEASLKSNQDHCSGSSSSIYHEVVSSVGDQSLKAVSEHGGFQASSASRPKSSSLPQAHSSQFRAGRLPPLPVVVPTPITANNNTDLTYNQINPVSPTDLPRAARKISNTSSFRP